MSTRWINFKNFRLVEQISRKSGLSVSEKRILGLLAQFSKDDGSSIKSSHSLLAEISFMSRIGVVRIIGRLLLKGFIIEISNNQTSRLPNEYALNMELIKLHQLDKISTCNPKSQGGGLVTQGYTNNTKEEYIYNGNSDLMEFVKLFSKP